MSAPQPIIRTRDLGRSFRVGSEEVVAVHDVSMEVRSGQFIAIVGRSGSGKTTLLNLMAGLDKPTSGMVLFEGRDLSRLTAGELTQIRRHKIGFVFQSFCHCESRASKDGSANCVCKRPWRWSV